MERSIISIRAPLVQQLIKRSIWCSCANQMDLWISCGSLHGATTPIFKGMVRGWAEGTVTGEFDGPGRRSPSPPVVAVVGVILFFFDQVGVKLMLWFGSRRGATQCLRAAVPVPDACPRLTSSLSLSTQPSHAWHTVTRCVCCYFLLVCPQASLNGVSLEFHVH